MAAVTGTTTEEISRWAAVADDANVSAADLQAAFLAVNKSLDDGKWAEYGIAVHDANGNLRSTNDIMLDTFDALAAIEDPAARNAASLELLGRGHRALAPMIGATREEMQGYLSAVEAGQVITAEEVAKAEEMRLAQDALSDSLAEVQLALGEVVVGLAPLITGYADMISAANEALGPLADLGFAIADVGAQAAMLQLGVLADGIGFISDAAGGAADAIGGFLGVSDGAGESADKSGAAFAAMGAEIEASAEDAAYAAEQQAALRAAVEAQAAALTATADAWTSMAEAQAAASGTAASLTDAQVAVQDQIAGFAEALVAAGDDALRQQQVFDDLAESTDAVARAALGVAEQQAALAGTTLSAVDALDVQNDSLVTQAAYLSGPMRQAVLDHIEQVNGIPPTVMTEVELLLEQGKVAEAQALIDETSRQRVLLIFAEIDDKARDTLDTLEGDVPSLVVDTSADTQPAEADLVDLVSQTRNADVYIVIQHRAEAERALDLVTADRDVAIDAYLRDIPTAQDIINRIGPVRVPVDAYLRTEPRVTGNR